MVFVKILRINYGVSYKVET